MLGRYRLSAMRALKIVTGALFGVLVLGACGQEAATQGEGGTSEPAPTSTPTSEPGSEPTSEPGGEPTSEPGGQPTTEPPVTEDQSGDVVVPEGVRRLPKAQVDARDVPEYWDHRGVVWVYGGGYSLQTFAMANNGCSGAKAEIVEQSADEVRLRLSSVPPEDKSKICTEALVARPVVVRLDEPIGDRMVVLRADV